MSSLSPSFNVLPYLHWLRGGAAALVGSQWRLRGCRRRWQCGRADPPTPLLSPFFLFCPFSPLSFPSLAVFSSVVPLLSSLFSLSFFAVSFPLSPLWFFLLSLSGSLKRPLELLPEDEDEVMKLRVISAVIERRFFFFLSFCYCFHSCTLLLLCFWFSEMTKDDGNAGSDLNDFLWLHYFLLLFWSSLFLSSCLFFLLSLSPSTPFLLLL